MKNVINPKPCKCNVTINKKMEAAENKNNKVLFTKNRIPTQT